MTNDLQNRICPSCGQSMDTIERQARVIQQLRQDRDKLIDCLRRSGPIREDEPEKAILPQLSL